MMDNGILIRQNEQNNIEFLAAQRQLYSDAKTLSMYQFALCVILPLLIPFLKGVCPSNSAQLAVVSLLPTAILLFNGFFLEKTIKVKKEKAAKVQELFDTSVFELPWNNKKCGQRIDALNKVKYYSDKYYHKNKSVENLKNWYPNAYASVSIEVGRLLCQRINLSWDNEIRRKFQHLLIFILCSCISAVLLVAIFEDKSFANTLVNIFIPIIPIIVYVVKRHHENRDTINRLDILKQKVDELWENLLSGQMGLEILITESRKFQDEIYNHRANAFMVWNWFYNLFRNSQEQDMNSVAEDIVKEYNHSKAVI